MLLFLFMVTTSPLLRVFFSLPSVCGQLWSIQNLAPVSFADCLPKLLCLCLIGDVLGRPATSGDCFTGAVSGRTRTVGVLSKEDGVKR